jgi:predicted transcriptional regulator
MADEQTQPDAVELATELTIAWLSNPMHEAVAALASPQAEGSEAETQTSHQPAVSVRKSLASPDEIISLIDGKPYKTLKRHLANNGLTPAEYRQRYGLKPDYPMVAPAYAQKRRDLANAIGLGRRPRQAGDAQPPKPRRSRSPKNAA